MNTVRRLSRAVVVFVAIAGFLFGQAFNGVFSVAGTLAGVGGVLAGGLATGAAQPTRNRIILAGCALGLLGAALHVWDYYGKPQLSGNYYPWFLTLPFAIGLLLIGSWAVRNTTSAVVRQSSI